MDNKNAIKKNADNDNRQVIVFQDGNETKDPNAFTWGKYGHFINVFKYWITGVTILCGVAGYLVMHFGVNPAKEKLTSSFTYQLPLNTSVQNGITYYSYFDGTTFDKNNIISSTNLKLVQDTVLDDNGNKKYAGVDLDGLITKKDISIEQNTKSVTSGTTTTDVDIPFSYTITAKNKYFGNEETGKAFIKDLIETVRTKSVNAMKSFQLESFITSKYGKTDFQSDVSALSSQYSYNNSILSNLISKFGGSTLVNDGTTATDQTLDELAREYSNRYVYNSVYNVFSKASQDITNGHYVLFTDDTLSDKLDYYRTLGAYTYSRTLASYNESFTSLKKEQDDLKNTSPYDASVAAKLETEILAVISNRNNLFADYENLGYVVDRTNYTVSIDENDPDQSNWGYIQYLVHPDTKIYASDTMTWRQRCEETSTNLNSYATTLKSDITAITNIYQTLYSTYQTDIVFASAGGVDLDGHLSGFIGVGVGLVVGFLGCSLILAGYGVSKDNKERLAKEEAGSTPTTPVATPKDVKVEKEVKKEDNDK
jgi:hypothetical protein